MTYHWIAGAVLTVSIIYHILHATFWMDFWSIWPDKADMEDASRRLKRFMGQDAPAPRRFAKYPLENKMYHGIIVLTGLAAIVTGVFMMFRVHTVFFPRNPYLFGDMTWGLMYVLHGLAGVGLIALVMVHIYFAVRPEKFVITKSMVFGSLPKEYYLEHHDPERWVVEAASSTPRGRRPDTMLAGVRDHCNAIEECYELMLGYAAQGLPGEQGSASGGQVREFLRRAVEATAGLARPTRTA